VLRRRYLPVDAWATFDGWTAGLPSWDVEGRSVSSVSGVTPSLFSSLKRRDQDASKTAQESIPHRGSTVISPPVLDGDSSEYLISTLVLTDIESCSETFWLPCLR
jgi:hypothetical protein